MRTEEDPTETEETEDTREPEVVCTVHDVCWGVDSEGNPFGHTSDDDDAETRMNTCWQTCRERGKA